MRQAAPEEKHLIAGGQVQSYVFEASNLEYVGWMILLRDWESVICWEACRAVIM